VSARVIITQPNPLLRGVLCDALTEEGFEVVAQCANAEEALQAAASVEADVLVTNVLMPRAGIDGYALTERLRADRPQLAVVIRSAHEGDDHVARARSAGARGFLSARGDLDVLAAALRQVAAGGTWFGDAGG